MINNLLVGSGKYPACLPCQYSTHTARFSLYPIQLSSADTFHRFLFIVPFLELLMQPISGPSSVHVLSHVQLFLARLPCPSPTPWPYSNSGPSSQWCHPTISSSVVPFFSCLQSFPALRSFQMNQFFTSGGQSIGVSALASVLPMNIQDWFPLGWTIWISLQSKGLSRVFSNSTVQRHQFFGTQLSL